MKHFALPLFAIFLASNLVAQNLVPNPSFESHSQCPSYIYEVNGYVDDWKIYGYNPDYNHTCALGTPVGVPQNSQGWQFAKTGEAYVGLITFHDFYPMLREYVGVQLTDSLQTGTTYYISFWVSLSNYSKYATNRIGALFTNSPYCENFNISTLLCDAPSVMLTPNNFAHYSETTIIADTAQWVNIKGSFVADSNYKYMALGNFYLDGPTNVQTMSGSTGRAYYYIDDVCVSADSNTCYSFPIGMEEEVYESDFISYPNPTLDVVNIDIQSNQSSTVRILSSQGKLIHMANFTTQKFTLTLPKAAGIYFIQVDVGDKRSTRKIVKY